MWGERPTRCPAMGNGRPCSKAVCNTGQRTNNYGPKMLLGFKLELVGSTHYLISFMAQRPCFLWFAVPGNCMKWPWSRRFWAGADCQFHGLQAGGLPSFGDSLKRFWWWFSVDSILNYISAKWKNNRTFFWGVVSVAFRTCTNKSYMTCRFQAWTHFWVVYPMICRVDFSHQ